jgi:hypothetical protein
MAENHRMADALLFFESSLWLRRKAHKGKNTRRPIFTGQPLIFFLIIAGVSQKKEGTAGWAG